jgi:hypothetical protein
MKRKLLVISGMLLGVLLLAQTPAGIQSGYAFVDCESDRWNAFLNANDTYTSTFRSWYFGEPVSCIQVCQNQCGPSNPTCMQACLNTCDTERYNAFTSAQDALLAAVNQSCPVNPDFCDQARYNRDQCVWDYNLAWQYPELDGNGNVDETWANTVSTTYSACWAASGINSCE